MSAPVPPKGYITPTELARLLGVSRTRVYQMIAEDKIPVRRFGGIYRIHVEDFDAAMADHPTLSHHHGAVTLERVRSMREEA